MQPLRVIAHFIVLPVVHEVEAHPPLVFDLAEEGLLFRPLLLPLFKSGFQSLLCQLPAGLLAKQYPHFYQNMVCRSAVGAPLECVELFPAGGREPAARQIDLVHGSGPFIQMAVQHDLRRQQFFRVSESDQRFFRLLWKCIIRRILREYSFRCPLGKRILRRLQLSRSSEPDRGSVCVLRKSGVDRRRGGHIFVKRKEGRQCLFFVVKTQNDPVCRFQHSMVFIPRC